MEGKEWNTLEERRQFVKRLRDSGKTWQEIANTINVCLERARQIYKQAERRQRIRIKIAQNIKDDTDSIINLELSARSDNWLRHANILTIDDLIKHSKQDLLRVKNLGKKSVAEIEAHLNRIGLHLKS